MDLQPKLLPWRPHVIVTGRSFYSVDAATGKLASQRDTWDAVSDNDYLSVEGLAYIVGSLTNPQARPPFRLDARVVGYALLPMPLLRSHRELIASPILSFKSASFTLLMNVACIGCTGNFPLCSVPVHLPCCLCYRSQTGVKPRDGCLRSVVVLHTIPHFASSTLGNIVSALKMGCS